MCIRDRAIAPPSIKLGGFRRELAHAVDPVAGPLHNSELPVSYTHLALFNAGEPADGAYIIQRGSFALNTETGNQSEVIAGPGTLLGETALLAETKRPATARAREDSTVLRISRTMFLRILDGYPDAALGLRDLIASRADQWARELENVCAVLTGDDITPR